MADLVLRCGGLSQCHCLSAPPANREYLPPLRVAWPVLETVRKRRIAALWATGTVSGRAILTSSPLDLCRRTAGTGTSRAHDTASHPRVPGDDHWGTGGQGRILAGYWPGWWGRAGRRRRSGWVQERRKICVRSPALSMLHFRG